MEATTPARHELPPEAQLMNMAMGYIVSQAVAVSARLKIADLVADGPKTPAELAAATNTHEPSLYRLLRALASLGIMVKDGDGRFSNAALGELLRSDHPQSMQGAFYMLGDPEHWNAHGNMQYSVETGEIAFDYTFGMPIFSFLGKNPKAADVFDRAMTSFTIATAAAVSANYDFGSAGTIADIAGGHGILLAKILQKYPSARGVLFDQQQVVDGNCLAGEGVADRTRTVSGDFFKEIPVVADIYLMKFILHDWNDEQCVDILRNLAKSAPSGSKLLIVETLVEEDDNQPSLSKIMDLNMLIMTGGRERTASEYAALFERSGFKLTDVHLTQPLQIIEAVRV